MKTYGDYLDQTAAALARARTALRQPPPGTIVDHEAAAIARTQLYRSLEWQIKIISDTPRSALNQAAHQATSQAPQRLPESPQSRSRVALALQEAATAVRTAGDILSTHLGPDGRQPRTSEGMAILGRVDQDRHLNRLARLIRAANDLDRRLAPWLRAGYHSGSGQPVVQKASEDAEQTAAVGLPEFSVTTEARPGFINDLRPAPLADSADRWSSIRSPRQAVAAIDSARAWLVQHRSHFTTADLTLLTRVGLALTYEVDHLVGTTLTPGTPDDVKALSERWLRAARAAEPLRSLHRSQPGEGPLTLAAAETWLRDQLRPAGQWRPLEEMQSSADFALWRETARDLAARLPDLATLIHHGARNAVERGELYEVQGIHRPIGKFLAEPRWGQARTNTGSAAELLRATGQLREHCVRLAENAGITPLPGLHEAESRYRHARRDLQEQLRQAAATRPVDAASITYKPAQPDRGAVTSSRQTAAPRTQNPFTMPNNFGKPVHLSIHRSQSPRSL